MSLGLLGFTKSGEGSSSSSLNQETTLNQPTAGKGKWVSWNSDCTEPGRTCFADQLPTVVLDPISR